MSSCTLAAALLLAPAIAVGRLVSTQVDVVYAHVDGRALALDAELPETIDSFTCDATATSNAVTVILSGTGGPPLVVYRLGPTLETAGSFTGR